MIIDIHVHPTVNPDEWPAFMARMRRAGVGLSVVSVLAGNHLAPTAENIRESNDKAKRYAESSNGSARWFSYLNPQLEGCVAELTRCLDEGAVGVKLLVALKDAQGRMDRGYPIIEETGRRGVPVLFHVFGKTEGNGQGEMDILDFADIAKRFPNATLIAAHSGGNWRESLAVLRTLGPNACVDVSGYYPERGQVEALAGAIGPERCLFGSDPPGRNTIAQVSKVALCALDDHAKEMILWRNAARLFHIDVSGVPPVPMPSASPDCGVDFASDHFCFCGRWPYFETPCESPAELDRELERRGRDAAYVADLGAIHRTDLLRANERFIADSRGCRRVRPLATVNPRARDWEHVLAAAKNGFAGAFVSPYLHGWKIDDPAHAAMFEAASKSGIPVWINCALHDIRVRHVSAAWSAVEPKGLLAFAKAAPPNRYVCQGAAIVPIRDILALGRPGVEFRFEISRLVDYGEQFVQVLRSGGARSLVLGTEYPFREMDCVPWSAARTSPEIA